MILIGQYDSPFVRRVGIALTTYGVAFEHRPWSTFGDVDKIATLNPLRRVPTLGWDDGAARRRRGPGGTPRAGGGARRGGGGRGGPPPAAPGGGPALPPPASPTR